MIKNKWVKLAHTHFLKTKPNIKIRSQIWKKKLYAKFAWKEFYKTPITFYLILVNALDHANISI